MNLDYKGCELQLFSKAVNWKKYFVSLISPYLNGKVGEVGSGIGGTTLFFSEVFYRCDWTCLEPDPKLLSCSEKKIVAKDFRINFVCDDISGLGNDSCDTLLYIDVLEHISDDKNELEKAVCKLKKGGRLIILSPAHNFLYTPFDRSIGHYRRYTKQSLKKIIPDNMKCRRLSYLDSIGFFASMANKLFLKQSVPTDRQIFIWDSILVKLSVLFDRIFLYKLGKSILGVWEKS